MYVLPHSHLLCPMPLVFIGVSAFTASTPTTAGPGYDGIQATPTPAPISSLIAPTGLSPNPRSETSASSFGLAASPSHIEKVDPYLLGGVPSGLRSLIVAASPHSTNCTPSNTAVAFPSMDVYYWPPSSSNTACLSTITEQSAAPPQPSAMISPFVYVVYPPLSVYDGCGHFLGPGPDPHETHTYGVEDMSTLQDIPGAAPVTQAFNFSDLPCPPPAIAEELDPGTAYRPVVIANWDPVFQFDTPDRKPPLEQADPVVADPARPIVRVNTITRPKRGPPP